MVQPIGFFKIWRELFTKPIWLNSTPEHKTILIALIAMANFNEKEWEWKGEKFEAKKGQFITSLESIRENCGRGVTTQNIRSALTRFEKLQFLTNESTKNGRLITIENWELYQSEENNQQCSQQTTNKEVTKSQQRGNKEVTPREEGKKDKNVKKERMKEIYKEIPAELHEPLDGFIEMRKSIKKPLTDRALTMLLKKLNELSNGDMQKSIDILNQSTMNCWTGIFPLKEKDKPKTNNVSFLDL